MHPVLLGTVAALSWGTLDLLAGLSSRRMGYVQTTAGVTLSGFLLLTLALAVFGPFPSFGFIDVLARHGGRCRDCACNHVPLRGACLRTHLARDTGGHVLSGFDCRGFRARLVPTRPFISSSRFSPYWAAPV